MTAAEAVEGILRFAEQNPMVMLPSDDNPARWREAVRELSDRYPAS